MKTQNRRSSEILISYHFLRITIGILKKTVETAPIFGNYDNPSGAINEGKMWENWAAISARSAVGAATLLTLKLTEIDWKKRRKLARPRAACADKNISLALLRWP